MLTKQEKIKRIADLKRSLKIPELSEYRRKSIKLLIERLEKELSEESEI